MENKKSSAPNVLSCRFSDLQDRALVTLLEVLITGIELLAAQIVSAPAPEASEGRFESARTAFLRVLQLSSNSGQDHAADFGGEFFSTYAGPRHLAALLLAANDGIDAAALTKLPPPAGTDQKIWKKWLQHRAARAPFIWPNHREAIAGGLSSDRQIGGCDPADRRRKNNAVVIEDCRRPGTKKESDIPCAYSRPRRATDR